MPYAKFVSNTEQGWESSTVSLHYQQDFFSETGGVSRETPCPRVLALLFTLERPVDNCRVSRQHVSKEQSFEHFSVHYSTQL